ncbi:arginine repressor [Brevibacillus borstelensis]|uniref:hypothetical protein n=1 Tax=Brevibacillus borstelensis TaxID=45462 RepID=UPI001D0A67C2|nr:hypothetical protein [Brevibacillus borstelensis]MCC0566949.1 hypothetical protein [Brevibacillus borstelensis]
MVLDRKVKRQSDIVKLIQTGKFKTQREIVKALKEIGHKENLSTISRDLKELNIDGKGKEYYDFTDSKRKEIERERLTKLIEDSHAYNSSLSTLWLRANPDYATVLATSLERYLAKQGFEVGTMVGPTGTILLGVDKDRSADVLKELISLGIRNERTHGTTATKKTKKRKNPARKEN